MRKTKSQSRSHGLEIRGWKKPTVQGTEDAGGLPLYANLISANLNVASTVGFFQPRISNPWLLLVVGSFATSLALFHALTNPNIKARTHEAQKVATTMVVPKWEIGDWWIVRQANTYAKFSNHGADFTLHDSLTDYTTIRFEVLGERKIKTLGFDQSPAYDCSEVKATESNPQASADLTDHYMLYYGRSDLVAEANCQVLLAQSWGDA